MAALLGLFTLWQYFYSDPITKEVITDQNRMRPVSALCLILISSATIGLNYCRDKLTSQFITLCLILVTLALSMLAILGALLQIEADSGWVRFTQMSFHTSFSFLLLSMILLYCATLTFLSRRFLILVGGLYAIVFAIDITSPLGNAIGIVYVPLVLSCLLFKQKESPILSAIFATWLVVLGYIASPPSDPLYHSLPVLNRLFSVLAIWVVAAVVYLFLRKERESIENKDKLELAMDCASLSPWNWNLATGDIEISDTIRRRLGFEKKECPKTIDAWRQFIEPEDPVKTDRDISKCIEGVATKFETQFRVKNKQNRWLVLRLIGRVTQYSVLGKATVMTGILEDITERVMKDEQLLLLETAIDHSRDALIITDANISSPSILYASQSNLHLSGYQPEELLGKNPNILQGPNHGKGAQLEQRQAIKNALSTHSIFSGELINVSKDGRDYWVRLTIFPVKNKEGVVTHFGSIGSDITREREYQNLLKLEQEQFQTAIESSPIGIGLVSLQGEWIKVNRALCNLLEYSEEELFQCSFKKITYPEDIELDLPYIQPMFDNEISSYEIEKRYVTKSGNVFWALLAVTLVRDRDGQPMHFISQVQNIDGRKQQEYSIKNYMAALEASNRELDDFAYIASHDLKEPLRGINNHALSLIKLYQGKLDERGQRKLERMATLSEKMESLISDLLYFSRLGRTEDAIEQVDFSELVKTEVELLQKSMDEVNSKVSIKSELPTLKLNKMKASVVFRNLISNALKYNDSDEKRVCIRYDATYLLDGKQLNHVFHVSDNGIGIDPIFHERIFKMFKKLNSDQRFASGTGAGLAFVDKILTQMGGVIWVTSSIGQGSTFHFSFEGAIND